MKPWVEFTRHMPVLSFHTTISLITHRDSCFITGFDNTWVSVPKCLTELWRPIPSFLSKALIYKAVWRSDILVSYFWLVIASLTQRIRLVCNLQTSLLETSEVGVDESGCDKRIDRGVQIARVRQYTKKQTAAWTAKLHMRRKSVVSRKCWTSKTVQISCPITRTQLNIRHGQDEASNQNVEEIMSENSSFSPGGRCH